MAAQLRLSAIREAPPASFIFRALTFDMTGVADTDFRAQLAQIIDLGVAATATSEALRAEVAALQGSGSARCIRFYSDQMRMTDETGTAVPGEGDSGASAWRGARGPMDADTPVAARTDLRVFIDPSGGSGVSILSADGSYKAPLWALVGTVWHELHHLATKEHHTEGSWPYSGAWAAAMDRIKAGLPPMIWDPMVRRMVSINTQGWHVENFSCGCRGIA